MIFLLQRSFGVDCDYSYTLYTYGPYSSDVSRDLDVVAGLGGAQVNYDSSFTGYEMRYMQNRRVLNCAGEQRHF